MSKDDWKCKCSICKNKGDEMFARLFYTQVNSKWVWLCKSCWDKELIK